MAVARDAFYNLIGSVVPLALALVTVPLYLHAIGQERYGVLTIAWMLLGYFGLFDLGLGRATTYRISALRHESPEKLPSVFWSAVLANVSMGLVGGAILWVGGVLVTGRVHNLTSQLQVEVFHSLPFLSMAVPVATLTGVLTGALQGQQRFLEVNLISTWTTALFQLIPLTAAVFVDNSLPTLLICSIGARLIGIAALAWCCRNFWTGSPSFDRDELKDLLRYGGWVSLESAINPILTMADRFLIGGMIGAAAVAAYAIPYQVVSRLAVLPNALSTALFPRLTGADAEHRVELSLLALRTMLSVLSVTAIGAAVVLHPFLRVWIGQKLATEAYLPGLIMIIAFWLNSLGYVAYSQLSSVGRPDLLAKVHAVELLPYGAALYFAVLKFGLVGAAMTYLARAILDYAILNRVAFSRILLPRQTAFFAASLLIVLALNSPPDLAVWRSALSLVIAFVVVGAAWVLLPSSVKMQLAKLGRLARARFD